MLSLRHRVANRLLVGDVMEKKDNGVGKRNVPPLHENQGKKIYTLGLEKEIICQKRPCTIS